MLSPLVAQRGDRLPIVSIRRLSSATRRRIAGARGRKEISQRAAWERLAAFLNSKRSPEAWRGRGELSRPAPNVCSQGACSNDDRGV